MREDAEGEVPENQSEDEDPRVVNVDLDAEDAEGFQDSEPPVEDFLNASNASARVEKLPPLVDFVDSFL